MRNFNFLLDFMPERRRVTSPGQPTGRGFPLDEEEEDDDLFSPVPPGEGDEIYSQMELDDDVQEPEEKAPMGDYQDWLGRRPKREDYKPSTGRKILAGLAGFLAGLQNPAAGAAVTRGIAHGKYEGALQDWQEEGKAIGDVAELGQKYAETERKGAANKMTYEASMTGIKQREEAEQLRHIDRKEKAVDDRSKNAEELRHNQELEKIQQEKNRIDAREAGASETRASAYKSRMEDLNKKGSRVKYTDAEDAFWDSVEELAVEMMPEAEEYIERDSKSGKAIGWKADLNLSPEEVSKFQILKNEAAKKARRKLENLELDDNDPASSYDIELPPPMRRRY